MPLDNFILTRVGLLIACLYWWNWCHYWESTFIAAFEIV